MKKSLPIKRAVFWLDGGARVPGWSTGKTWNGWGVPLFDESQIEAARAALRAAGIESELHSGDILELWPVEEPDLITEHQAIRLKGKTYYWQLDGLTWNEESSGGRRADEASADVWGHAPLPESMLRDVARDLRRLNNMTSSAAFREGTKLRVYLQLADDGTWGIGDREPTSGRWGSAAIPGNNRRFNATAVARDLLAQVERDSHAEERHMREDNKKGPFFVTLSAAPNRDFGPGSHEASVRIPPRKQKVVSLAYASKVVQRFIAEHDLGSGNWTGGLITDASGKAIGRVAYNGRIFDLDDKIMWDNQTSPGVREDRFEIPGWIAAVGWSGVEWVVYGIGEDEDEAAADARNWTETPWLTFLPISKDQIAAMGDHKEENRCAAIGLDVGNASRTAPRHLRAEEHRVRESRFEIPGWSVGYHSEISAHAAVRTGRGRDWLFVMTTPEDREPRSLDEEVTVGLYFFDGDDWEQIAYVDFPDVRSVIKLGDAELHLVIEHGLSLDQSRELLVQEFDDWDGEDTLTSWMQTILKDAGVEPEEAGADAATHEATEQIYNASPAQILEYMDERSKALNE
jgi:hypothetical protein